MPSIDRGNAYSVLSSDWTGLSPHLIAKFFPVRRALSGDSFYYEREPNSVEVQAPITDGAVEQSATWTSPFENQTADAKLSSFSALAQIGGFQPALNALQQLLGNNAAGNAVGAGNASLASLEGRTAITKLNSTQIFTGAPPTKITVTAHFRALRDSLTEVSQPMDQLMKWELPKHLAAQGLVGNVVTGQASGWRTVYASEIPTLVGMNYADRTFLPLVIETATYPLTGPRDARGRMISAQMTLTLGSLTALDAADWDATRTT